MSARENFIIQTPERVNLTYQLADIGARFLAALLDSLIIGVWLAIVNVVTALLGNLAFKNTLLSSSISIVIGILILLQLAIFLGYYILFESFWQGQTPGKRAVGLRVLTTQGTPCGFSEIALRNLLRLIDVLPSFYVTGFLAMLFQPQGRRLGDLAAGTLVVYDQKKVQLATVEQELTLGEQALPTELELSDLPVLTAEQHANGWLNALEQIQNPAKEWVNPRAMVDYMYTQLSQQQGFTPKLVAFSEKQAFLQAVYLANKTQAKTD